MSVDRFLLYLVTWSLVAVTPGPAVICTMAQATRYGFRASLAGIAGIQFGNFIFFGCTAFGLATTATAAFGILRAAGAAYLIYVGVRMILSTFRRPSTRQSSFVRPAQRNLLVQGMAIQLTNPKALLFVSALLPQFVDPRSPLLPQLTVLVAATIAVDLAVLLSYALVAWRGRQSFQNSNLSAWLERFFGAAFVIFGLRLLCSHK